MYDFLSFSYGIYMLFKKKNVTFASRIIINMIYFIKRSVVWLRRAQYSRGFGVQSPWAYKFIRYVVNEHYPYYKYAQLKQQVYGINKRVRKLCRLYFRIANFQQPHSFIDYLPFSSCYKIYTLAGAKKTLYQLISQDTTPESYTRILAEVGDNSIVRVSLRGNYREFIDKAIDLLPSTSVLILEHIKCNKETEAYWKSLVADDRTGITFDLYYCGLIFLDKTMIKQDYIVNF